jgi:phenylacetic acid degradation operon negative regulatory protein
VRSATSTRVPKAGSDPSRRSPPARIHLYMFLGEYVVPAGGSAWTEVLVDALDLVGVREKAARQAIARLATDGMLVSHRRGRRVRWEVTDRGRRWLREGWSRSVRFHAPADASIGRWLVLIVSLGDEQR